MSSEKIIPYGRQLIDDEDIAAVVEVLRGDWLTQGPAVERFERALAERCGARYAVAVANGTVALQLACRAAGVEPGDEGITSPLTFLASATCLVACGARPRFADVDDGAWLIDPIAAEASVTARTKVLIPVDFAGLPCDLVALRGVADRRGLVVIVDGCHSLGASHRGLPVGGTGLAEMTCLSFHPVKAITTGEGGAIVTDDELLAKRLRTLRHHGMTKDPAELTREEGPWYYELHQASQNGRLTDLQCALGASQLGKLERFIDRRRAIAGRYREALGQRPGITLQRLPADREHAYHLFVIHLDPERFDRREVFQTLASRGVCCQVHYYPVHLQPFFRETLGTALGDCPKAEAYYAGCLSLPIYPALSDEDLERVVDTLTATLDELDRS